MKGGYLLLLACISISAGYLLSAFTHNSKPSLAEPVLSTSGEVFPGDQRFVRVFEFDVERETEYANIDFGFAYTSFLIELFEEHELRDFTFTTAERTSFNLDLNSKPDHDGNRFLTNFVIPDQLQRTMSLYTGNLSGRIRVYLFYAPPLSGSFAGQLYKSEDSCGKPAMVTGKTWREGLPAPTGTREPSTVRHNIIHHAASSNSNHNYLNVVRNIYLLHTQSNGWDDIGYNFLVAQDGTIFEGRDPQGLGDMDDVKGAHFCGKNGNTMGICALGNYMEVAPSSAMIKSLKHLLVWKCFKSGIDPESEARHPNASGSLLNAIAGHRDGCATACPGDSLYRLIPEMMTSVRRTWLNCGGVSGIQPVRSSRSQRITASLQMGELIITNPVNWSRGEIVTLDGRTVLNFKREEKAFPTEKGMFIVRLWNGNVALGTTKIFIGD